MKRKIAILGACVIVLAGAVGVKMSSQPATDAVSKSQSKKYEYTDIQKDQKEETDVAKEEDTATSEKKKTEYIKVDINPDSYTVLVNREHLISKDYIPGDLVIPNISFSFYGRFEKSYMRQRAAGALEDLFAGAKKKGYTLKGVSAYRSYERQKQIYDNNVRSRGTTQTDKVSAVPGSSEHQTGLSIDVSSDSVGCSIETSFGSTKEGKWLEKNCYKYGFIIRYPKDKTKITGYSYEPWHIRYVGKNLAKYLYKNNLTLEEYYKITTIDNKVAADPVEDTDTNAAADKKAETAPTPRPTKKPKATPVPTPTATPKKTKKPKKTQKPKATKKPTPKPTKKVVATKKPIVTAKPTQTPVRHTEAPSQEPTQTPAAEEPGM